MQKIYAKLNKGAGNRGFSLIELIIVVAIMAVLIGILAPQYLKYVEKSRVSADEQFADQLKSSVSTALSDDDYYNTLKAGTITWDTTEQSDESIDVGTTAVGGALTALLGDGYNKQYAKSKAAASAATYEIVLESTTNGALQILQSATGWSGDPTKTLNAN